LGVALPSSKSFLVCVFRALKHLLFLGCTTHLARARFEPTATWRYHPQNPSFFVCFVDAFVYGAQLMRPSGFYYATLYHSELYDVCYRRVYDDPQFPLSNHRRECAEDCESYTRLPSPIIGPAKMIDMRKGEMSRR
jgi:hypothetical protein